jgi:hypothetical protein
VTKIVGMILLMVTVAGVASAVEGQPVVGAPEIDPASAVSGLTLLLGSLAVIRGRFGKKK